MCYNKLLSLYVIYLIISVSLGSCHYHCSHFYCNLCYRYERKRDASHQTLFKV